MVCSLQKDSATGGYMERQGHLVVQISKDDKSKSVGVCKINMADFVATPENGGKNKVKQKLLMEKCPDKGANIVCTMSTQPINGGSSALSCMMSDM